jgi:tetratricopeptide (TPR) repeat protein
LDPRFLPAYLEGGELAVQMRRYDEARDQFRRAAALVGDTLGALVKLVDGAERPADRPAAIRVAEQLLANGQIPIAIVARFFSMLDQPDRAIALLEQAVAQRAPFTTYLNRWAELRRLESDPRYRAILKRIGLPLPDSAPARPGA